MQVSLHIAQMLCVRSSCTPKIAKYLSEYCFSMGWFDVPVWNARAEVTEMAKAKNYVCIE